MHNLTKKRFVSFINKAKNKQAFQPACFHMEKIKTEVPYTIFVL